MVTTQLIRRQVETYQEAWKQDYHAAQECHDCEEFVRLGLFIFAELKKVNQFWRERVYRGRQEYSRETGSQLKALFSVWLEVSSNLLRHNVARLQKSFKVVGADDLQIAQNEAIDILHDWKAPKLSRCVGLRTQQLSATASVEFTKLITEANKHPAPSLVPSNVVEVSAEEFLKSARRKSRAKVAV